MPAKLTEILNIAAHYEIPVIEDAAEALGSKYNGKMLGTYGEMGVLSFNGNKIITTSGGGALVSNQKQYADNALFLATQARDKAPHYQHSKIGYNYRMSNIVAGIGRGQMQVIDERVKQRRENFQFYRDELGRYDFIKFLEEPENAFSNYWLTTILIDQEKADRELVRAKLENKNIETRPLWKPMHLQPVFQDYPVYEKGVSQNLFQKGLCLPSGSNITDEEKQFIISELHNLFQ
jgi:dTDP-4-amino-4,6-dideoxygalactose transaminase